MYVGNTILGATALSEDKICVLHTTNTLNRKDFTLPFFSF